MKRKVRPDGTLHVKIGNDPDAIELDEIYYKLNWKHTEFDEDGAILHLLNPIVKQFLFLPWRIIEKLLKKKPR